jgi:hypothetical protein
MIIFSSSYDQPTVWQYFKRIYLRFSPTVPVPLRCVGADFIGGSRFIPPVTIEKSPSSDEDLSGRSEKI